MALSERVTQEDLILYEIVKNPILFGEFINNVDKLDYEEKFEWTSYQKEFIGDFNPYVSLCCGRAVGKTESMTWLLVWVLINNVFPNDYVIYTVPNKVHLEPVFSRLVRVFRSNSFLKNFIKPNSGFNSSEFTVTLVNNAKLLCRIAGTSGGGGNVIGLHSPFEVLDEGGYYPWGTWVELQPTLNTWTPGMRLIVSGVPTGLRERNVLYHCDFENSSFTKHRISAIDNPRFSEEDEARAREQYGGVESDDYIHLVLGQHGKPIFSLFDRASFQIESYPVYRLVINGAQMSDNIGEYMNKLSLFPSVDKDQKIIIGIDLGYTEPTAIVVMTVDKHARFRFHGRIRLEKVSYAIQERFIDAIDTKFKPIIIGIDEGGVGKPVVQRLLDDREFTHKDYHKKMYPINFSGPIIIGKDADGEDIKQKSKPLAVSVLQEYSNNGKIVYSSTDLEMVTELERMTYTKTTTGDIVYKTLTERGGKRGEDHFTQALLCLVLGYYIKNETLNLQKSRGKLAHTFWYVGT